MPKPTRATRRRRSLRGVAALAFVVLSGLGLGAAPAHAATPCWKTVLNDWFVDGRIDGTYPVACYTQAQQHIGDDAKTYSSFGDDARRALLATIRQDRGNGPGGGGSGGSGGSTPSAGGPGSSAGGAASSSSGNRNGNRDTVAPAKQPGDRAGARGPVNRAIDWLGPSNAESIPLPLLVLGGIALLLLAAAAASFLARRIQARRLRPVPAPLHGPKRP